MFKKPGKKSLHTPHKLNADCCQIIREAKDSALHAYCFTGGDLTRLRQSSHRKITCWTIDATHYPQGRGDTLKPGFSCWGLRVSLDCRKVLLVFTHVMRRPFLGPKQKNVLVSYLHENSVEFHEGSNCFVMRHKNGYRDVWGKPRIPSL